MEQTTDVSRAREMPPNELNLMPALDILKKLHTFLKKNTVFSSFPLSLLLIGLEELIEINFSCPCSVGLNRNLTVFIFTGPALCAFVLMFLILRPLRYKWSLCLKCVNDSWWIGFNALLSCLIPPVIWIIILLLDGDYFACSMTDWKGCYVFDKELNRLWCKPTEGMQNETEPRYLTRKYLHYSQFLGYLGIFVFSALMIICIVVYDCLNYKSRDVFTQYEEQDAGHDKVESEGKGAGQDEVESEEEGYDQLSLITIQEDYPSTAEDSSEESHV